MKIKEICELTGLTDKTIRFYIENNLITPQCTQNHLGRRAFTFDEQNLDELNDIATLRKSGFSVAQIKEIQEECEKSTMHVVVSGTKEAILMVEAGANEVSEEVMLQAILFAHEEIKKQTSYIQNPRTPLPINFHCGMLWLSKKKLRILP